jgi:hypothetical protein
MKFKVKCTNMIANNSYHNVDLPMASPGTGFMVCCIIISFSRFLIVATVTLSPPSLDMAENT